MRQRMRLAALVMFYVLISTAAASAECAWVLWYEETSWTTGSSTRHEWGVVGAFTQTGCRADQNAKIQAVSDSWGRERVEGRKDRVETIANTISRTWDGPDGKRGVESRRYLCLPDTVDPRVPKGK